MAKIELIGGHIGIKLIIEMAKIEINRRPYWIYANYRDGQNGIYRRLHWIMLLIEITKIKLTGSHIVIMLNIEMAKIKLTRGHIGIMLILEMAKIELTGGHIGFIELI